MTNLKINQLRKLYDEKVKNESDQLMIANEYCLYKMNKKVALKLDFEQIIKRKFLETVYTAKVEDFKEFVTYIKKECIVQGDNISLLRDSYNIYKIIINNRFSVSLINNDLFIEDKKIKLTENY